MNQIDIEKTFSRKQVFTDIRNWLLDQPDMQDKVAEGVQILKDFMSKSYYESKNNRLKQMEDIDLKSLVENIFTHSSIVIKEELFVSFTSQLALSLGFSDRKDAIQTVAEIVVVLADLNVYDIGKPSPMASLTIKTRINLPHHFIDAVGICHYLPPMIEPPRYVTSNYEGAYYTFDDCQILGKGSGHLGDISLDVINTQNAIPLVLNEEFLSSVKEVPSHDLDTLDKRTLWRQFLNESNKVYQLLQDREFYLTNKVDKRGRLYAQGYHVSTQSVAYKKAMIDFANQEYVDGVPQS